MAGFNPIASVPIADVLVVASNVQASQFAAIFSVTQMPSVRASQFAVIFSVSPGKPQRHAPINVRSFGPLTLFTDMPVTKKPKEI